MRQVAGRLGDAVPQPRDARSRARRRQGARHRRAQPADRRARVARRRRRLPRHRRLRHGLLPVDQRRELERHGGVALLQARRAVRQPVLHADPSDLHPGVGRSPVEAHADEREPAQRRPRLGAEDGRRQAAAAADPRSRARLLPRAPLPELRQPRAPRRRLARRQVGLRRRPRRRRHRPRRLSRFRRRHPPRRRGHRARPLRQPVPDVREDHRRGSVQGADADLPRRPLHDGRPVGGLQPDEHRSRACTSWARPTSPITAPTASAPAP